jgi:N-acetylmuramoyl-L-alanine amidase
MVTSVIMVLVLIMLLPRDAQARDKSGRITTIVIDAGHGGKDPGALGRNSREKDITLKVALKTGELIRKQHPDVKVVYTRTKDEFIELHRRAEIANRTKADLFISIHCNAHKSRTHYGAETFVMGLHRSQANLDVARFENAAILYEDDYKEKYEGFDPNSPESYIIFSMYQNIYREQSLLMASLVQNELGDKSKRFDRGVKEAGFLVLYCTTMPSVLVELGFISNSNEEEYLRSSQGQQQLAESLAAAFTSYRQHTEKNSKPREVISQARPNPTIINTTSADSPAMASPETLSVVRNTQTGSLDTQKTGQGKRQEPQSVKTKTSSSVTDVTWRVQILTSPKKLNQSHSKLKNMGNIFEYYHKGAWKYTTGAFSTEEEALVYRNQLKNQGFSDAFVVPFAGNERITPEEARKLQGK